MKSLEKFKKALLYISDLIIFLLIGVWVISAIFTAICAVYDLISNHSPEGLTQFVIIIGLPFTTGLVIYSLRCAITHFFANKNGKAPDPDFTPEEEFEIADDSMCSELENSQSQTYYNIDDLNSLLESVKNTVGENNG